MKRWSKLQRELYKIICDHSGFQIHCVAYPMKSQRGSTSLSRYYITVEKNIIWDYPADFIKDEGMVHEYYPYVSDVSKISEIIREYIDFPNDQILEYNFPDDKWGLTSILKIFDRRIGKKKLELWVNKQGCNKKLSDLLKHRMNNQAKNKS
jgi:hypothetical protein